MPCQEPVWTSQYNMSSSHLFLDQRLLKFSVPKVAGCDNAHVIDAI